MTPAEETFAVQEFSPTASAKNDGPKAESVAETAHTEKVVDKEDVKVVDTLPILQEARLAYDSASEEEQLALIKRFAKYVYENHVGSDTVSRQTIQNAYTDRSKPHQKTKDAIIAAFDYVVEETQNKNPLLSVRAKKVIDFYNKDEREAALAIGVPMKKLRGKNSMKELAMMEEAIQIADTPNAEKVNYLLEFYASVYEILEGYEKVGKRHVLVPKAKVIVWDLINQLKRNKVTKTLVNKLFWRCKKYGKEVVAEAHLQEVNEDKKHRLAFLVKPILLSRIRMIENLTLVVGDAEYSNGVVLPALRPHASKATCLFITLKKLKEVFKKDKLPSPLWFKLSPRENPDKVDIFDSKYSSSPSLSIPLAENEDSMVLLNVKAMEECTKKAKPMDAVSPQVCIVEVYSTGAAVCQDKLGIKAVVNDTEKSVGILSDLEEFYEIVPSADSLITFLESMPKEKKRERKSTAATEEVQEEQPEPVSSSEDDVDEEEEEAVVEEVKREEDREIDDPKVGTLELRVPSGNRLSTEKAIHKVYRSTKDGLLYRLTGSMNKVYLDNWDRVKFDDAALGGQDINELGLVGFLETSTGKRHKVYRKITGLFYTSGDDEIPVRIGQDGLHFFMPCF